MSKRFQFGSLWLFLFVPLVHAAVLESRTVKAWDDYVHAADSRMKSHLDEGHFLWMEQSPEKMQSLRQGEVVVFPFDSHHLKTVPGGLIHDWIGAIFIPHTTLREVLAVVRDYDRYRDYYGPTVVDSRTISQADVRDHFAMVWLNKALFLSTALEGEYQSSYTYLDGKRCYSTSYSTRVQQIEHFQEADERELPPDEGSGYIWRLHSISKFEERDGGVYVELEAMALSRPIPFALHWVVDPIVTRLSKNSLGESLRQSREAVRASGDLAKAASKRHAMTSSFAAAQ